MLFKRESRGETLHKSYEDELYSKIRDLQDEQAKQQNLSEITSVETEGGRYYRYKVTAKYNFLYKIVRQLYLHDKN